MPRVIGLVILALLAVAAFAAMARGRGARPGTYRPKPKWADILDEIRGTPRAATPEPAAAGLVHVVKRSELSGVRDAFSSARLDPGSALVRCGSCLSFYSAESRAALERENSGRCVVCNGTDLGRVSLVDDE